MSDRPLSKRVLSDQPALVKRYLAGILEMVGEVPEGPVLDLGCGSGEYTSLFASRLGSVQIVGADIDPPALGTARGRGLEVVRANAELPLPFPDMTFSVVISSQVIEHMHNADLFADELYRVLKNGGFAVIATENLASWHNVLALVLGYQPFTENVSELRRIGNPYMQNYGEVPRFDNLHVKVFTYKSFLEFLELHNFYVIEGRGFGYHPLPSVLSGLFSRIDPRHSRYIVAKVGKR